MEAARPQTAGEKELPLQLALAMSREEAEQDDLETSSLQSSEDDLELESSQSSEDDLEHSKKNQLGYAISNDDLDKVKSILTERPDLLRWDESMHVQLFWEGEGQNYVYFAL